mmetsp:Transcript_44792/g.149593  ORF Transcript_44792/g.149593 Transcript_44792/m.149593 type:complete len:791 (+) Transcript_44792:127-2499(+)
MAMHNPPGQGLHPYLALSRRHPLLLLPRGDVEEDLLEGGLRQRVTLEPQLCRRRFERTEDGAELDGAALRARLHLEGLVAAVRLDEVRRGEEPCDERRRAAGRLWRPLELDAVAAAVARLEVLRRADHLQPAARHDADPLRERVRLLHVVRSEDERAAALALGADPLPEELARADVDARRRLVEEADARVGGEGDGRDELAARAARELAHRLAHVVLQPELGDDAVAVRAQLRLRHALEPAVRLEVLVQGEPARVGVEEAAELGAVAAQSEDVEQLRADRVAAHPRVATARPQVAGQHREGGRLAGAVGAEQAEAAAVHGEAEVVHRDLARLPHALDPRRGESLAQVLQEQRRANPVRPAARHRLGARALGRHVLVLSGGGRRAGDVSADRPVEALDVDPPEEPEPERQGDAGDGDAEERAGVERRVEVAQRAAVAVVDLDHEGEEVADGRRVWLGRVEERLELRLLGDEVERVEASGDRADRREQREEGEHPEGDVGLAHRRDGEDDGGVHDEDLQHLAHDVADHVVCAVGRLDLAPEEEVEEGEEADRGRAGEQHLEEEGGDGGEGGRGGAHREHHDEHEGAVVPDEQQPDRELAHPAQRGREAHDHHLVVALGDEPLLDKLRDGAEREEEEDEGEDVWRDDGAVREGQVRLRLAHVRQQRGRARERAVAAHTGEQRARDGVQRDGKSRLVRAVVEQAARRGQGRRARAVRPERRRPEGARRGATDRDADAGSVLERRGRVAKGRLERGRAQARLQRARLGRVRERDGAGVCEVGGGALEGVRRGEGH